MELIKRLGTSKSRSSAGARRWAPGVRPTATQATGRIPPSRRSV